MLVKPFAKTLAAASALLLLPLAVFAQTPQLPHLFYGGVTINGGPAPVGTVIVARVGGVEKGRIATTQLGTYGGPGAFDPKLLVQGEGLAAGAAIAFSVSGVAAAQAASFESGELEALDLAFTIQQVEVTPATLVNLLADGTFSVSGTDEEAESVTATQIVSIEVTVEGGASRVVLPRGVQITRSDGGTFNAAGLTAAGAAPESLSGLGAGLSANGALQWGLPGVGLEFSAPVTLSIFVGADLNGETLEVLRSITGTSGWTGDGIVAPGTCVVSSGLCTFSATKASYFVAAETVSPPALSSGGGGGGGGGGPVAPASEAEGPARRADTNRDGRVDILDFNALMVHWNETGLNVAADIDGDGRVDLLDFNLLMVYWTI